MTAKLIDGKAFAASVNADTASKAAAFTARHGFAPGLAVILIGQHPPSEIYVNVKSKAAQKAGINAVIHRFDADIDSKTVEALINELNENPHVQGILLQLPLPDHLSPLALLNAITPTKDVDGLTVLNAGRRGMGLSCHLPCTPKGALRLIKSVCPDLRGKRAVVIGRSDLVGKPMAQLLLAQDCTVTQAHRYTTDLPIVCREADIVVVAVGQSKMVKADWIKEGAVVIDVGINRMDDGTLTGDVDFADVQAKAGYITPVPGGVGPMTVACLLENCVTEIELS